MQEPKISVIVPIYRVENYLPQCLDSLLHQTFSDFEVLMVNDGSPDGSAGIAAEYAERDPRFRLINKENGGVATARNTGLNAARGEYIAFVDGDDSVKPEYLSALYTAAQESAADVVCCNFQLYNPKLRVGHPHFLTKRPGIYSAKVMLKCLLHDVTVQSYLWNKLWKRSLFEKNGIRFPLIRFEDMATVLQLFFFSDKVRIIPDVLYNYTQRGSSIVHTFRPEVENDFLCSFLLLRMFLESQNVYRQYRWHFRLYAVKSLFFMWGVVFLMHFQEKNFRGMFANLRRSTAFLNCYAKSRLPEPENRPDHQNVVRAPADKPAHKKRRLAGNE